MLDDSDLKFGNFATFPDECKRTCFENILLKEIEIINPKVIFTFSTNVYKHIEKQIEEINKKRNPHQLLFNYLIPLVHTKAF